MELSDLTFRILIIFLPGIITTFIIQNLNTLSKWNNWKFGLCSFLFGFLSYLILDLITCAPLKIWDVSTNEKLIIPQNEILYGCIIALFLGILLVFLISKRILFKIFRTLNITSKYGDGNLYYEFLRDDELSLIYIGDIEKEIKISGHVKAYSESNTIREIHLKDVRVYNYYTGELIDELQSLYKSWPIEKEIIIEQININDGTKNGNKGN